MSTSPRHGDPGCPCEECLSALIRVSAERAADGRDMSGLRTRLEDLRGGRTTTTEALRSVS